MSATRASVIAALLLVFALVNDASAYRIILDYDTDLSPATVNNVVDGPESVPVTFWVVYSQADRLLLSYGLSLPLNFFIEWDCEGACADADMEPWPGFRGRAFIDPATVSPGFDNMEIGNCPLVDCECQANQYIRVTVEDGDVFPRLGIWEFTRVGVDVSSCLPRAFDEVNFRISCDNDPNCEGGNTFTMRGESNPVSTATWGAVKARYD